MHTLPQVPEREDGVIGNMVTSPILSELNIDQLDDNLLAALFEEHRERFVRRIRNRLDSRLVSKIDPQDVFQEAFLSAKARLPQRCRGAVMNVLVWLRLEVDQAIAQTHRSNLRLKRYPSRQIVSLHNARSTRPEETGEFIDIAGTGTSPSNAAIRDESRTLVASLIVELNQTERSILALRHFECLSNKECAEFLGINPKAASERYRRALAALGRAIQKREAAMSLSPAATTDDSESVYAQK